METYPGADLTVEQILDALSRQVKQQLSSCGHNAKNQDFRLMVRCGVFAAPHWVLISGKGVQARKGPFRALVQGSNDVFFYEHCKLRTGRNHHQNCDGIYASALKTTSRPHIHVACLQILARGDHLISFSLEHHLQR